MTIPRVFILTAVHNGQKNTRELLRCVGRQNYKNIETHVVDDGSTDGTSEYIRENYSEIKLIKGNGKLWWTGSLFEGVSSILKEANKKDFILIINNDCVFNDDFVEKLVEGSLDNNRAIVGSLIIDKKNKKLVWDAGVKVDWNRGRFYGIGPKVVSQVPRDVVYQQGTDTLPTKGTLYPIEVFRSVGNFDKKNLPHYLSDYEFGLRAKRNGFKLLVSYKARVYNDIKRTGLGDTIPPRFSLIYFFVLLFSRRSKVNIIDQWNLIKIACPDKYKAKNYALIFAKIIHYLLHVFPLFVILSIVKYTKRTLGIENVTVTKNISRYFGF